MFLITYWHDGDDETITSHLCNTESEANQIREILERYDMDVISVDELSVSTPAEIEQMFKDIYEE